MTLKLFASWSLKTRVTLFTLAIFLISMWSLAYCASRTLHVDMQRLLGEQQMSTVALVAAEVNEELEDRFSALSKIAARISPSLLANTEHLQAFLQQRPVLLGMFNAGVIAYRMDGTAIAEGVRSGEPFDVNLKDADYVRAALENGKSTIGRPVMGATTRAPIFGMAVPILDAQGKVIGALTGVTDLGSPSFLDEITHGHYGHTGGYSLISRQHRLIITSTDGSRVMTALPDSGVVATIDNAIRGFEGSVVYVSSVGVERLASSKGIPVANWTLVGSLPTVEAFAPIHAMQQRMVMATILLTVLAGWLTGWMLKRQLLPMRVAAKTLADMAQKKQPLQPLPVTRDDEIGLLVGGFNSVLTTLGQQEEALKESEERYRTAFLTSPDSLNINRLSDGLYMEVNDGFLRLVGWSREEVIGRTSREINIWHNMEDRQRLITALMHRGYCENLEAAFVAKDGRIIMGLMSAHVITLKNVKCILSVTRDITERKTAENQLRKLSLAVEQSSESIVITNIDAKIEYVNEAFIKNTGYRWDEIIGQNPRILHSGKTPGETYTALWDAMSQGLPWKGEFHNRRKDGSEYVELAVITPIRQPDGCVTHYVAVKEDITAMKAAENTINNLAFYDPLTGLPNRRLLLDRLKQALASSSRSASYGALLFIDLDNFKTLNDTLGHDIGDVLLQQVAQRLSTCVREGDTVARLGGDEFVVILEDLSEDPREAATQTETVGRKILAALNQAYLLNGYSHHSTPSIGVTLFAEHHGAIDELLKRADLAMYQAKSAGRNTLRFFEPAMQSVVTTRAALEAGLREAVLHDQLALHYQAQVDEDGTVTGVEALLRWQHPQRGLVSPAEFIPLAEETGVILPMGRWVLETACRQLAAWAVRPEMAHLTVAVNVSAHEFHYFDFVNQVLAVLEQTGANPQRLKLELTESLLVNDVEGVIAKMMALKAKGVGFSLDDFGTGYSSLTYLKRLPLDQLKIDQGFIRDILSDPNDAAIAKMVIALANSMGLEVIAEGVETEAQRNFLAAQGCRAYQGYLFSRPLSIQDFESFVRPR